MIDFWIPTVDGRRLILRRYTQPAAETKILLDKLALKLPPRITAPGRELSVAETSR